MSLQINRTALLALAVLAAGAVGAGAREPLDLDQRVACGQAIEEVRWRHRIWPTENPDPKPPLTVILPPEAIQRDVERTLRLSGALEHFWQRPVSASDLAAELHRVFRDTRAPGRLAEVARALDDDGYLLAECLARPLLVERLARSFYESDERLGAGADRPSFDEWLTRVEPELDLSPAGDPAAWADWRPPARGPGASDTWTPTAALPESTIGITAVWTGTEMIVWGGQSGTFVFDTGGRYAPATDSWQSTSTVGAPVGRSYHVMVWTGTRMVVWGGTTENFETSTGGLYDPGSDSWTATALAGAPPAAAYSSGVWTGGHAIVWGGWGDGGDRSTGGVYDPALNAWTAVAPAGAPAARHFHTGLWTGARMLVWGGMEGTLDNGTYLSSGGLYDPATGSWVPTALAAAPEGRIWHAGVWDGREAIVWGGCNGPSNCGNGLFTGARYDPEGDQWTATPLARAPGARANHTGVWTGDALVVWGGVADAYGSYTSTGGLYVPPLDVIFADGFESGDTGTWSFTLP